MESDNDTFDGLTPGPSPKERGAERVPEKNPGYQTADKSMAKQLILHSKNNRKEQTNSEACLWEALRNKKLGEKFRRQHAVGRYIADFICLEKRLIIEIDGGYHSMPEQTELDENRQLELEQKYRFKVLRFSDQEVLVDIESVVKIIKLHLSGGYDYAP